MENATKALLIAAAVLITIIVISLGLIVYRMAAGAVNDANLNEAEITTFNSKFEAYEGKTVSGSKVNQMLRTVLAHNTTNTDTAKKVSVTGAVTMANTATSLPDTMADTGKSYIVKCVIGSSGFITSITVTANNT
ncbi:MAG: hypothetical protein HFJ48_04545 [Clostridia bacterium]|nr:hypothetical protein [Clostridia bacterium]